LDVFERSHSLRLYCHTPEKGSKLHLINIKKNAKANMQIQVTGQENAGLENEGPHNRAGKYRIE